MLLKNKIKEFQRIAGVKNVDGVWGGISQTPHDVSNFIENLELIEMEKQDENKEEKTCTCRCECGARPDYMV